MSKIFYINNNNFHHLGRPQICAAAWCLFRISKPHSERLWVVCTLLHNSHKSFQIMVIVEKMFKTFILYITIQMIYSYNFSLFAYFLLIYGDCCSWRPRAWRQVTWWHDDVRWLIRGPGRNSFTFNQRILDEKWNRLTKWFLKDTNCCVWQIFVWQCLCLSISLHYYL